MARADIRIKDAERCWCRRPFLRAPSSSFPCALLPNPFRQLGTHCSPAFSSISRIHRLIVGFRFERVLRRLRLPAANLWPRAFFLPFCGFLRRWKRPAVAQSSRHLCPPPPSRKLLLLPVLLLVPAVPSGTPACGGCSALLCFALLSSPLLSAVLSSRERTGRGEGTRSAGRGREGQRVRADKFMCDLVCALLLRHPLPSSASPRRSTAAPPNPSQILPHAPRHALPRATIALTATGWVDEDGKWKRESRATNAAAAAAAACCLQSILVRWLADCCEWTSVVNSASSPALEWYGCVGCELLRCCSKLAHCASTTVAAVTTAPAARLSLVATAISAAATSGSQSACHLLNFATTLVVALVAATVAACCR
jgi:hypothetical protein